MHGVVVRMQARFNTALFPRIWAVLGPTNRRGMGVFRLGVGVSGVGSRMGLDWVLL
jgi:hypothetical protein